MSGHRQTFLAASAARALLHYGSLEDNARRSLTAAEIDWNDELLTSSLRCLSKIHFRLNGVLREVGAGAQAPGNEEQADSRVSRRRPRLASALRLPYRTCRRWSWDGLSAIISSAEIGLRCFSKIHSRLDGVPREVGAGAQAPGNEEQADGTEEHWPTAPSAQVSSLSSSPFDPGPWTNHHCKTHCTCGNRRNSRSPLIPSRWVHTREP